jgi:hypothetical protein
MLGRLGGESAAERGSAEIELRCLLQRSPTPNRVCSASARTLMASCWRRSIASSTTRERIVLFPGGDYPHRVPSNSTSMPDPVELMWIR